MVTNVQVAISVMNIAISAGKIGLDCEGCKLSRPGKFCLVQVISTAALAIASGQSVIQL